MNKVMYRVVVALFRLIVGACLGLVLMTAFFGCLESKHVDDHREFTTTKDGVTVSGEVIVTIEYAKYTVAEYVGCTTLGIIMVLLATYIEETDDEAKKPSTKVIPGAPTDDNKKALLEITAEP